MYVMSHSDMVEELVDEACGMFPPKGVVHYFIVTMNDCVDVIADHEPQLEYKQ